MHQIEIANRLSQLEHYAAQIERTWDDVSFGNLPSRSERLSQLATGVYNLQMRLFSGELYHPDAPALIETLEGYRSQIEKWDGMFSGRDKAEACCVILRHWRDLILKPVPVRDDWQTL